MNVLIIILGIFLWFALLFVGGLGESFLTYSAIASGFFMVITGILIRISETKIIIRCSAFIALLGYLPIVWWHFNSELGTDWPGLIIDAFFILVITVLIATGKPK